MEWSQKTSKVAGKCVETDAYATADDTQDKTTATSTMTTTARRQLSQTASECHRTFEAQVLL